MYLRDIYAEHHIPTLRQFIRDNPLGIFTTAIPSPGNPLLQSSHIPWILDVADEASDTELGTLHGHMARANPQAKAIIESITSNPTENDNAPKLQEEVLILFDGPVHHYITPKFYTETKPATGKVVPTWNYAAVQVYGKATIYFDAKAQATADFLARQLPDLSQHAETHIMGYDKPWAVADAPAPYVELLKKAIIGIEVQITSMGGKFKMSQERVKGDRDGIIEGFEALGTETGMRMAEMVKETACRIGRRRSLAVNDRISSIGDEYFACGYQFLS
ncbi:hypothetical protein A0H81_06849 [Grifola frondosa]|uniref:Transcriptional regulator n=1 Tax=Grifola frondosa TaxID=5627 RepID=A0A1C7M7H8_GRIFR|nr:hypothetical protein A0H81_06849 [Grifola frondosa]